jgi:hypothetical protein
MCLIYECHNCTVHQILLGRLKGWACGMYGREGFGTASRALSYHWHATSVEMRDPEIVSPLHLPFSSCPVLNQDKSVALTGTCIASKTNYIHIQFCCTN